MGDDRRKIVELRRPVEIGADALRPGDDRGGISGSARGYISREIDSRHTLHGLDHFADRIAEPVAAIING